MIEKMRKYSFVLYHRDYEAFLTELQKLGVLHLIRNTDAKTESLVQNLELIGDYAEASTFLKKLASEAEKGATTLTPKMLLNKITEAREEKERLTRQAETLRKQIRELEPWGRFDYELKKKLEANGIKVDFHTCLKNHFKPQWEEEYAISKISEVNGILYFVVFHTGEKPVLDADTFSFHKHTIKELEDQLKGVEGRIADIDEFLQNTAPTAIESFAEEIGRLSQACEYEDATLQGTSEADDHIRVVGGFIPIRLEPELKNFLERNGVIHFATDATVEDNPPVSLRNGWFARQFEPISKMYMLPFYDEFDLTPFFAPFFMLFFGFCNADIAYGVIFILLALVLRAKAKNPAMKSIMMLVVLFGISSIIMGWVMGSALGYDLKKTALDKYIIIRNNDQIFNFALLLGAIQILFGTIINGFKQACQSGFMYFLAPFGTFLFLLGLSVLGAGLLGADISSTQPYVNYVILAGLALLMLFNSPGKNPLKNILSGFWALYGVITGFFGDILSYIRLFALGVSSAILGFVMNSIGQQFLSIKIIGPVIFFIFMVVGHSLNIALSALSGFVHPLRLTFVEFFKNAGFNGPGLEYKPFGKTKKINV
ncbi:MAG TPA: V-type ATPase 116kDa subunit family protein [Candidatus Syntrophosphaera sp.]|nr:V-type ATPase 116kDa subunit family protein [Candidatus Syntrophosphaera sp.]HRT60374.1 V-type ATPase 116kDa subunit family protein [Candidatus Syntrophosphaera sp.]